MFINKGRNKGTSTFNNLDFPRTLQRAGSLSVPLTPVLYPSLTGFSVCGRKGSSVRDVSGGSTDVIRGGGT